MSLNLDDIIIEKKNKKKKINLKNYIEKNSEFLKKEYLHNCSILEKKKVFGKKLYDLFNVFNDHNLWEMSKIKEKSNLTSKSIFVAIQFLAIKEIIEKNKPDKIYLNYNYFEKEILFFLKKKNIKVVGRDKLRKNKLFSIKLFIKLLTLNLKSIVTKLFFNSLNNKVPKYKADIIFFGSFAHYKFYKNKFVFKHFYNLEKFLKKKFSIKKELIFVPSRKLKNNKLLINKNNDFNLLNFYLKTQDKILIILYYFIYSLRFFFTKILILNHLDSNFKFFFNIHSREYDTSFYGDVLIDNLIWIKIFENYFSNINKIKLGIFLIENQPWEKAMIRSWKKYNHGTLIGYTPSTINFWHMYNYDISKNFEYLPSYLFVSSQQGYDLLKNQCKNKKITIHKAETLWLKKEKKLNRVKNNSILILGDLDNKNNIQIIQYILKSRVLNKYRIFFKPHPHDLKDYTIKSVKIINKDIDQIKNNFKYIISASSTSAVLEFFDKYNRIYIFDDQNDLNLSPLKHLKYPLFFKDDKELEKLLKHDKKLNANLLKKIREFFFQNRELQMWQKKIQKILKVDRL